MVCRERPGDRVRRASGSGRARPGRGCRRDEHLRDHRAFGGSAGPSALRRYEVSPVGTQAGPDILRCRASLQQMEETLRTLLARLEREAKSLRRLHVLPAVPVSAAIALGRAHHPQVHPQLVIYERLAGSYMPTLEVGQVPG
ncbi:SAVED domain-containing protein [Streptomyces mexicanus]